MFLAEFDSIPFCPFAQIWADLLRAKKPPEDRPELLVSLSYLPHAERMTINIMKARNLNAEVEPSVRVSEIALNCTRHTSRFRLV